MQHLRTGDIIALGFMTFALFIGAGNIIFPPIVAQQAGDHVWLAAIGFLITAVGLPVITIMALSRMQGSIEIISSPLGRVASLILTVVCYLSVGPLFATPRTATVSYEIGFSSYFGTSSSSLFNLQRNLFFICNCSFTLSKQVIRYCWSCACSPKNYCFSNFRYCSSYDPSGLRPCSNQPLR